MFYGLPKDHKAGLSLRPVVSSCDSPTSTLSLIVERILNQHLMFVPAHLDSTEACIDDIKRHRQVPDGCIIASFDVVGLYSNIPIDESISAAITKLEQHKDDVVMLGLTVADVQLILQYVLSNNYFEFNSKQYRQKRGIAMGNHLAPPLAILVMDALEQKALSTATMKPDLYKRYIDDCILLWRHGWKGLAALLDHFNGQHTTINFTMEHSVNETQSVNFLDLALSVRGSSIEWELYVNPFRADPFYSSKLTFQRTDSPGVVFAHRSERIFLSVQFTWMDFHHPGLVGKIRTKRIHPGSSQLNMHGGATSMSCRNYFTMPRKGTATRSHILFRFLVPGQPIFTIQTALQT